MSTGNSGGIRYARRVAIRVKGDQIENFLSKMRNEIFPSLRSQNGIRRIYLLRTPGENEFVSLTLWDNKSYADSYGASGSFSGNTESLRDFLQSEPSLTEFDVELHDVNAEDLPPPKTAVRRAKNVTKRSKSKTKKKNKKRKSR